MWSNIEQVAGLLMMLAGALVVAGLMSGCTTRPYQVCSELRCTKPLTHDETVQAQEIKKAWGPDAPLHVEVAP
jgi:hypothetical protein